MIFNKYPFQSLVLSTPKIRGILTSEYKECGKYPIIDQGNTFIAGYTNNEEVLYKDSLPVVIFGDHTLSLKFVDFPFCVGADGTQILKPNDRIIIGKYLYYSILHLNIQSLGYSRHFKVLKKAKFLVPPLEDQKRIVKILETADALRQKRKLAITLLDDYIKSVFLDLFGDPISNPKGWETRTIEYLVKKEKHSIKRGPFGGSLKKEIFVDQGYLVYEQFHALNNDFSMARYFINEEKFQELKAFEVKADDIIISCSGVYLGKLAIVPKNCKKGIINQALLKLTLDQSRMNNIFFVSVFSNKNFSNKYFGNKIGSGIPNFPPISEFKKFKFIFPPLDLQDIYADIVQKTESLKQSMLIQSAELDTQFQSLLQSSFRGEL